MSGTDARHRDELAAEGYRLLSEDTHAFAEAALPLARETWPEWEPVQAEEPPDPRGGETT